MISADSFLSAGLVRGTSFYAGVPCSYLAPLINATIRRSDLIYVGAASEGEAVAIAAGAWLAGKKSAVLCQNSGLGNVVNPLTSLNYPFRIPVLLISSWRGQPGKPDEPQHELMGRITQSLLGLLEVDCAPCPNAPTEIAPLLDRAFSHMEDSGLPFALIACDGDFEPITLPTYPVAPIMRGELERWERLDGECTRAEILEQFLSLADKETAVIATTGKCGRELFTLSDREQHLYMVGAMGAAAPLALGVALNSSKRVVVLDGDGAALMKLGAFATIGKEHPGNLVHIVLDNQAHDSTGGQATAPTKFAEVAVSCGYRFAYECSDRRGFEAAYRSAISRLGPSCIHMRIAPGSLAKLGRPTIPPKVVARRFQEFLMRK